ncbi:MAG: DUF1501 domain-containing protein [Planctomycetota bacterium]|nr:DUF1501 domain-containing protein [Planctomycetota bacterium]
MFDVVFGNSASTPPANRSRRSFLRVGGLSALGWSATSLLRHEAQANDQANLRATAKSVVLIYVGGGMSHIDTFDLKPAAPTEIRGKFKPIATNVSGLHICEHLPNLSQMMDQVCLVRSGAHSNTHHETATNWVLSGRFGSPFGDWPALGAVAAHEFGLHGKIPPYVAIPLNPFFTWELGKSAYLGGRYESFKAGDPNEANYRVRDLTPTESLPELRLQRRRSFLHTVDQLARQIEGSDQLAAYDQYQQNAAAMVLSGQARKAFAIEEEADALRDRYGRNTFGQSCLLARRLIEAGVRFTTIHFANWDHHSAVFDQLEAKLPMFDLGLSAFLKDLEQRGLLDETLVVCMGEFGRTPKINKDSGRDHWSQAASMLFAGAGVRTGQVVGATDREGAYVTQRPISPEDVGYSILTSLGIIPHKQLQTPDGRPVEILETGRRIEEIFV